MYSDLYPSTLLHANRVYLDDASFLLNIFLVIAFHVFDVAAQPKIPVDNIFKNPPT
ncbi:hypothetical protein BCR42DRAFT_426149 [Absidia repens]|uniref:Uncharacterized protein n=1 Tax=Absidia repens TaxID=90262 RepID=A0A1X2I1U3_9FUNG|nr:hypothetical protein BCR42DRAFT_426149 [Absidia repens]